MKKFILFILIVFSFLITQNINVYALDIVPTKVNMTQTNTIGVYQVSNDIQIYKEPDENSTVLYRIKWNSVEFFPEELGYEKFFAVYIEKKSLAYVNVTDITDDWVEIIYDNSKNKKGWIKMDDPYKFMTWINFYNTYGKKYGLVILNGSSDITKNMKAETTDDAPTISTINYPKKINLNVIRGNWALVSVLDMDKTPKTGYVRWRTDNGIRYYFPNLLAN